MTAVEAWSPADGLTLEKNALLAVKELEHSLALTAGPGAGKTEVLAQRADFLLRTGESRYPKRILAISFKVDASKNLKQRVQKRCGFELASRFDSYTFHGFAKRIVDRFRPVLQGDHILEPGYKIGTQFIRGKQIKLDQLIPLAIKILSSCPAARNALCQTYSDVFLDEFQDCTTQQYELLNLIFLGKPIRLTAVGDVKQKIMGWAGAMDGIFARFVDDFGAKPLHLFRNFRSKPKLLRMQNEVIRALDPDAVMAGELIAGDEGAIIAYHFENSEREAAYIVNTIRQWVTVDQIPLHEIAILFSRQISDYGTFIMEGLDAAGIPYRNEHLSQDLVNEPVARLIIDYLACLYRPREPKGWMRLMEQFSVVDSEDNESTVQAAFELIYGAHRKRVKAVARSAQPYDFWWDMAQEFLERVGLPMLTSLSPDYEAHARLGEIVIQTHQQLNVLYEQGSDLLSALDRFSNDQAIRLLTVHKSKGLEFHSVIMPAIETQTFWGDPYEERCSFFVGISRAKDRLLLTNCERRFKPPTHPARWNESRSQHAEFMSYVAPFLST